MITDKKKLNKVAGYRVMLGLTQEQMGELLGMSKQQYQAKEKGRTRFNDQEKRAIKEMLEPYFSDITIDTLFF